MQTYHLFENTSEIPMLSITIGLFSLEINESCTKIDSHICLFPAPDHALIQVKCLIYKLQCYSYIYETEHSKIPGI